MSTTSEELKQRAKQFGLRILILLNNLPKTIGGRAVASQLVCSATSVGANYRAACRARSRAEFAAKLRTVLEEADGSLYWLELIRDGELMLDSKVSLLLTEADELTAILAAGRKSAASNRTSNIEHLT